MADAETPVTVVAKAIGVSMDIPTTGVTKVGDKKEDLKKVNMDKKKEDEKSLSPVKSDKFAWGYAKGKWDQLMKVVPGFDDKRVVVGAVGIGMTASFAAGWLAARAYYAHYWPEKTKEGYVKEIGKFHQTMFKHMKLYFSLAAPAVLISEGLKGVVSYLKEADTFCLVFGALGVSAKVWYDSKLPKLLHNMSKFMKSFNAATIADMPKDWTLCKVDDTEWNSMSSEEHTKLLKEWRVQYRLFQNAKDEETPWEYTPHMMVCVAKLANVAKYVKPEEFNKEYAEVYDSHEMATFIRTHFGQNMVKFLCGRTTLNCVWAVGFGILIYEVIRALEIDQKDVVDKIYDTFGWSGKEESKEGKGKKGKNKKNKKSMYGSNYIEEHQTFLAEYDVQDTDKWLAGVQKGGTKMGAYIAEEQAMFIQDWAEKHNGKSPLYSQYAQWVHNSKEGMDSKYVDCNKEGKTELLHMVIDLAKKLGVTLEEIKHIHIAMGEEKQTHKAEEKAENDIHQKLMNGYESKLLEKEKEAKEAKEKIAILEKTVASMKESTDKQIALATENLLKESAANTAIKNAEMDAKIAQAEAKFLSTQLKQQQTVPPEPKTEDGFQIVQSKKDKKAEKKKQKEQKEASDTKEDKKNVQCKKCKGAFMVSQNVFDKNKDNLICRKCRYTCEKCKYAFFVTGIASLNKFKEHIQNCNGQPEKHATTAFTYVSTPVGEGKIVTVLGNKESTTALKPWSKEKTDEYIIQFNALKNSAKEGPMEEMLKPENSQFTGFGYVHGGLIKCNHHLTYKNPWSSLDNVKITRLIMEAGEKKKLVSVENAKEVKESTDYMSFENTYTAKDSKQSLEFCPQAPMITYAPGNIYIRNPLTKVVSAGFSPMKGVHNAWTEPGWSGLPIWQAVNPNDPNDMRLGICGMHFEGGHSIKVSGHDKVFPNKFITNDELGK